MLPGDSKNIDRILFLFKNNYTMKQIGDKFGVTRQAISDKLIRYFNYKRNITIEKSIVNTCIVCGSEEIETKNIPVCKREGFLKSNRIKSSFKKKRYICKDCLANNLWKCTCCGSVCHYTEILYSLRRIKSHTGLCKECNKKNLLFWKDKNPEEFKKITNRWRKNNLNYFRIYQRNRIKKRKENGLCVRCGSSDVVVDKFYCAKCLIKNRERCKIRWYNLHH